MNYVLAALIAVALALVLVGAITGRIKITNCCSIADPSMDLRMRAAFEDDRADSA